MPILRIVFLAMVLAITSTLSFADDENQQADAKKSPALPAGQKTQITPISIKRPQISGPQIKRIDPNTQNLTPRQFPVVNQPRQPINGPDMVTTNIGYESLQQPALQPTMVRTPPIEQSRVKPSPFGATSVSPGAIKSGTVKQPAIKPAPVKAGQNKPSPIQQTSVGKTNIQPTPLKDQKSSQSTSAQTNVVGNIVNFLKSRPHNKSRRNIDDLDSVGGEFADQDDFRARDRDLERPGESLMDQQQQQQQQMQQPSSRDECR